MKSVEILKYLNVLSYSAPVVWRHIGRIQQRVVLYNCVDYPLFVFTQTETERKKKTSLQTCIFNIHLIRQQKS